MQSEETFSLREQQSRAEASPLASEVVSAVRFSRLRIPCLDGLRAISILLVLMGHAFSTIPRLPRYLESVKPILTNGHLGVMVFFVISGYLITTLLYSEWQSTRSIDLVGFYRRRVARIFPAFYAYIFVIVGLTSLGVLSIAPVQIFAAASFLWNYHHIWSHTVNEGEWFLGHFWTLSLEEQFYLLWPLTLLLVSPARACRFALTVILASPFLRVGSYFLWPASRAQIVLMLHTAADPLMFGSFVALAQDTPRFKVAWRHVKGLGALVPITAACFVLFISPYLVVWMYAGYELTLGMTLEGFCITVVMFWLVHHAESRIGRVLQHPAVVHVGVLSYSLYIWQQLFLTHINKTWSGLFPLNLLVSFVLAEVSYRLIERPFLQWSRRRGNSACAVSSFP